LGSHRHVGREEAFVAMCAVEVDHVNPPDRSKPFATFVPAAHTTEDLYVSPTAAIPTNTNFLSTLVRLDNVRRVRQ